MTPRARSLAPRTGVAFRLFNGVGPLDYGNFGAQSPSPWTCCLRFAGVLAGARRKTRSRWLGHQPFRSGLSPAGRYRRFLPMVPPPPSLSRRNEDSPYAAESEPGAGHRERGTRIGPGNVNRGPGTGNAPAPLSPDYSAFFSSAGCPPGGASSALGALGAYLAARAMASVFSQPTFSGLAGFTVTLVP